MMTQRESCSEKQTTQMILLQKALEEGLWSSTLYFLGDQEIKCLIFIG